MIFYFSRIGIVYRVDSVGELDNDLLVYIRLEWGSFAIF